MFKDTFGKIVLEIDPRLGNMTRKDKELKVTEAEFFAAIKAYKLDEALEQFAIISKKIFDDSYPKEYYRMGNGGIQHPSGVLVTQFAIEYLAAACILSGSNNWKSESIKSRDNLLGLLNIYHNSLVQKTREKFTITSLLIPMYFQQIISQTDPKNTLSRQWYLFCKIHPRLNNKDFSNLDVILKNETGLSMLEYTKLAFVIFATVLTFPRFHIGKLTGANIKGLNDVLGEEKMGAFLNLVSSSYEEFRKLDAEINKDLDPVYTKTRFNPLWLKPLVKLGENDYLAPSTTAYMTSTFKGLFWWFDNYFRKQSNSKGNDFRSYFGSLYEEYVGDVTKDIYGENNVSPEISYGSKKNGRKFFDWIVAKDDKVFLFEAKGYQFPLEILQKGDPEGIRKEVVNRIIKTIIQMYKRVQDVENFEELKHLRGKKLVPIAVFYEIPLVSTTIYEDNILSALEDLEKKYRGIKDFKRYLLGIEELEHYYYVSETEDIDDLTDRVIKNPQTGFNREVTELCHKDPTSKKNILDRAFNEYCDDVIGVKDTD